MPFDASPITSPDIELLEKVHEIIKNGWVQEHEAVDGRGMHVSSRNENAVRFCLIGALHKVCFSNDYRLERLNDYRFARLMGFDGAESLIGWNDSRSRVKQEVLNRVTENIDRLRSELLNKVTSN